MRENRPYGSEGGAGDIPPFLPLSVPGPKAWSINRRGSPSLTTNQPGCFVVVELDWEPGH